MNTVYISSYYQLPVLPYVVGYLYQHHSFASH